MKKVKLHFKLTLNNYLNDVRYFYIENENVEVKLAEYATGKYVYEHTYETLDIYQNLDIDLSVGGLPGSCFELEVTVDGKKLQQFPITCCASKKGIALLDNNGGSGYPIE